MYSFSLVFLACSLFISKSEARWATPEEADAAYENYERSVHIKEDGQSEEIISIDIKILNEHGRERHGIQRLYYNEDIEKIEIMEATAIHKGKKYVVPKNMREEKSMASQGSGFDQLGQVVISYPQVEVGTQLHLKYKVKTKRQPLPKYYATSFSYGKEAFWQKSKVTIKSELPLHKVVFDPRDHLSVTESKDKKNQIITIELKKPIFEQVRNEHSLPDPNLLTWVEVSTFDKFDEFGNSHAPNFERVINEALPPLLESIRMEAEKLTNPVDQLNKVSSLLAEKIRYMGDWRTVEGRFTPHSLDEIEKSGVGDCKDFSVAMGAIMAKLGFTAHAVLVDRGEGYIENKKALPSCELYDHAMLKVVDKTGKVYWVDPTNMVSMADGIFPDISNRPALVLDPEKSTLEMIPNINPEHKIVMNEKTLTLKKKSVDKIEEEIINTKGVLTFKGEEALYLTGATLSNSPQVVGEGLIRNLSKEASPLNQKVDLPDLSSRIVTDLKIGYEFDQENVTLFTNEGKGIPLDSPWSRPYIQAPKDQVGVLYVGVPNHLVRKVTLKDVKVNHPENLNYEIKSPWLEASRQCKSIEGGIEITENVITLNGFVTGEEVRSPAFQELRNKLKKCCVQVAAIISQTSKN